MKPDCPVCQIGLSGLPSVEQELLALVRFMCEYILATSLGTLTTSSQA
jgi:hypothetical protein